MDEISSLAKIQQLLEKIENDLDSAKGLLQIAMGEIPEAGVNQNKDFTEKAKTLSVSEGGKVIEGVFDGQNMVGPDGRIYPVPANYASKSKLIEGDVLKLSIAPDGSFIYKQIGPIERQRIIGVLVQDDKGEYKVVAEGKTYKVLLASLTYYKAEVGDKVTILVPEDDESIWAAVENVIKDSDATGTTAPEYNDGEEDELKIPQTEDDQDEEGDLSPKREVRILSDDDDDI